ncbi:RGG repeats nuclear RNA binding protein A-like isoform X2 [Arachis ipaensis]|uniref:RGG repeats nuclear RNA binding protein A-like isoform X2 n=1 Tax=Arachis ipaensis TaxID=130454 RepID=UPI000A2B1F01|nr:RGG repeats nuclear RNA binding protein A-like isoform X2 [Arachis ipaensis]
MATSNPFHLRGDDAEVSSRQIAAAAATSPLKKGSAAAAQQQQQTQLASKPVPPAQAVLLAMSLLGWSSSAWISLCHVSTWMVCVFLSSISLIN